LIVPVRDDKQAVVAIVQVFSGRPQGFSDRDLLALQGFGRHIVDHIEAAERSFGSIPKIRGKAEPETVLGRKTLSRFAQPFNTVKGAFMHERLTLALGVLIIGLAILLGWTIGRSERNRAHQNRGAPASPVVNHSQIAVTPAEPNRPSVVQDANQRGEPVGPTNALELNTKNDQSPPKTESPKNLLKSRQSSRLVASDSSSKGLVVFEGGKQVFPMRALQSQPFTDAEANREGKSGKPKSEDQETPVSIGEDVAEGHLLNRIEPEYPESAREQRLQGTVVLNINVGKDGNVHSLSRVAGDSQLALLAAKAVRQWKFAPLVRDGAPVSFESQVTLSFALP
jgi:TonB family protein